MFKPAEALKAVCILHAKCPEGAYGICKLKSHHHHPSPLYLTITYCSHNKGQIWYGGYLSVEYNSSTVAVDSVKQHLALYHHSLSCCGTQSAVAKLLTLSLFHLVYHME